MAVFPAEMMASRGVNESSLMVPTIIITGASGFIGRHLLDDLKKEFRIFGIARRSQRECGAPVHPNIAWMRVDIGDYQALTRAFREIQTAGGARFLIHLAAYYDFTGAKSPEYQRTNIDGTRYLLELAEPLRLQRLIFASSVAACAFPEPGKVITEATPPDGDHIYAWSKRMGESMVRDFSDRIPSSIVRFGAVYSDWCEYPPLYMFLNTWLGRSWRSRIIAGSGNSAIPYIHIRDIVRFLRQLIISQASLRQWEILIASTPASTTHARLFELASRYWFGDSRKPILLSPILAALGLYAMNLGGALIRKRPFERPWMRRYIDKQLNIDPSKTYDLLRWQPNPGLYLERRLPFLIERIKSEPFEWHARNMAIIRRITDRPDLFLYNKMREAEQELSPSLARSIQDITNRSKYPNFGVMDLEELLWLIKLLLQLMLTSIQSNNRLLLLHYVQIAAPGRFQAGYSVEELLHLFEDMHSQIIGMFRAMDIMATYSRPIHDNVTLPILMAKDEILQQFEDYQRRGPIVPDTEPEQPSVKALSARELLEQTVWSCLVQRKPPGPLKEDR